MIELKRDIEARLPVRLYDSATGLPAGGVAFSSLTVTVEKADGISMDVTVTAGDWEENLMGAFIGTGKYTILLPASATDVPGCLTYAIAATGLKTYMGAVKVVDNEEVDTYNLLGFPMLGTVSDDLAAISSYEERILDFAEGRWKVDKVLKQMVCYKLDGVTELRRFNLFNDLGNPDVDIVFDKVPIP